MWHILGIEPTGDREAIRRAYARCLKHLDPDQDPEAFQRLRSAYEAALAGAQSESAPWDAAESSRDDELWPLDPSRSPPVLGRQDGASIPPPPPVRIHVRLRPAPAPLPPPRQRSHLAPVEMGANLAAEGQPVLAALECALDEKDAVEAVRLFQTAMARGLLPVERDRDLALRLSRVAVEDGDLPGPDFCALVKRLGWTSATDPPDQPGSELGIEIFGRLDAEEWYAALLAAADARSPWTTAARVLLGRSRYFFHGHETGRRIAAQIRAYDRHHRWLSARFDPERMNQLYHAFAEESRVSLQLYRLLRVLARFFLWFLLLGITSAIWHAIARLGNP